MCFTEGNIWCQAKNNNQCNSYGSNCHKKLPLHWNIEQWLKCLQKKKRVYVLGDISSMVIHIQESAMDLKEVQYLLFNGYE